MCVVSALYINLVAGWKTLKLCTRLQEAGNFGWWRAAMNPTLIWEVLSFFPRSCAPPSDESIKYTEGHTRTQFDKTASWRALRLKANLGVWWGYPTRIRDKNRQIALTFGSVWIKSSGGLFGYGLLFGGLNKRARKGHFKPKCVSTSFQVTLFFVGLLMMHLVTKFHVTMAMWLRGRILHLRNDQNGLLQIKKKTGSLSLDGWDFWKLFFLVVHLLMIHLPTKFHGTWWKWLGGGNFHKIQRNQMDWD